MQGTEFYKKILNSYLNVKIIPRTDFSFLIENYPYLGIPKREKFCMKAGMLDCDGVLNRKDAQELYKDVFDELAKRNSLIRRDFDKLLKIDEKIQKPEDVSIAKEKFSSFFRTHKLKKEEFDSACEEVAENFVKYSLIKGARRCVYRLEKELGYLLAVISGCPRKALERVTESMGIKSENIYATEYFFNKEGEFESLNLILGFEKPKEKDSFLKKNVQTRYGCCFVFEDDPILSAPYMKTGINPSILIGKYLKSLPFDVVTCCPEARDNLEELIKEVYKFEYGWVSIHSLENEELKNIIELSKRFRSLDPSDLKNKEKFCKILIEILEIKEKYRLISSPSWLKKLITNLIITKDQEESKKLMGKIWKFSLSNFPELHL